MTRPNETSELTLHLAYAEASAMLIEALLHLLIDRNVLTVEAVIETVEATLETKRLLAKEGTHPEISAVAAGLLNGIANSVAAGHARGKDR